MSSSRVWIVRRSSLQLLSIGWIQCTHKHTHTHTHFWVAMELSLSLFHSQQCRHKPIFWTNSEMECTKGAKGRSEPRKQCKSVHQTLCLLQSPQSCRLQGWRPAAAADNTLRTKRAEHEALSRCPGPSAVNKSDWRRKKRVQKHLRSWDIECIHVLRPLSKFHVVNDALQVSFGEMHSNVTQHMSWNAKTRDEEKQKPTKLQKFST